MAELNQISKIWEVAIRRYGDVTNKKLDDLAIRGLTTVDELRDAIESQNKVFDDFKQKRHGLYAAYDKDYLASKYGVYQAEAKEALQAQLHKIPQDRKNDVVLDFPFAYRDTRDDYRKIVESGGARVVLVYLKTDSSTLWRRIEERAMAGLDADSAFKMTPEVFS
jgi:hypothetical protein